MIHKRALLVLLLLFSPASVFAQGEDDDFFLMMQAVEYSAKADAYSLYCKKDGGLADGFIEKFRDNIGASDVQVQALVSLQGEMYKEMQATLTETAKPCDDLDFMMERLEVMRSLKDASYLLNGIDPKTVPAPDMPNIEDLLPPPRL